MTYQKLKTLFLEMCNYNSIRNDIPANIYFHTFLGAYFRDTKISWGMSNKDLRVHPFWLQPSRTGKDQLNKVLNDVAISAGIKSVIITDISSDASFIGTFDNYAHQYNTENGLSKNAPSRKNKKGGMVTYKDPIIKGDLANYQLIIISEGKLLFQTQSKKLLTILQPALDYPGIIRKKMKQEEPIEYECTASLVITSIPFKEISKSILDQGFFQRCALFIRRLSIEEIRQMRTEAKKLRNPNYKQKYLNAKIEFLQILNSLENIPETLEVSDSAEEVLNKLQNNFIDEISTKVQGTDTMNALSFTQTAEEIALKMAGHIAILEGSNKIHAKHVKKTYAVIYRIVDTILSEIEVEPDKAEYEDKRRLLNVIKGIIGTETYPLTDLTKKIADAFPFGISVARKKIDNLLQENHLVIELGDKNTKLIKVRK